ncbi:MAG: type IV pilus assembly protein PilM [Patescibacteria group bacterium]
MFKKKQSYLGVDIGTTSIKVVELQKVGSKPQLINYGYSNEAVDFSEKNLQLDINKAGQILKKVCADIGVKGKQAVAAMPSFSVFSSVLNLSNVGPKEIENAVMLEAKKIIPLDLNEMVLDWKLVNKAGDNPEKGKREKIKDEKKEGNNVSSIKVLLTGAPKSLVNKYIEIFKIAELNLLSLETEMFSLVRSLVGSDPSVIAVVDWGAVNTDIAIIENGLPMFSRSLDTGGIMITKAITKNLRVDFKRAEQFKLDLNTSQNDKDEQPKIVTETISPIINEIKYSFSLFQQENNKKIEKIVLSGGGANLAGLSAYLSSTLNVNVVLGDPWARVSYPLDLKPALEEVGSRMAIAVGLALREVN